MTRHWFFCGERACPALGGEAAPTPSPSSTRYTELAGFGSAAQPSGGQAPLPQRAMQHPGTRCQHRLFLWRAGLPRAGWRSRPNTLTTFYQIHRGEWFWVCCAAQRGTSPLATEGYAAACNLLPTTGFFVASGLAPRWAAKPPQHPHDVLPDTPRGMVLGLLRSPAGDKPPCHRGLCSTLELAANTGFSCGERACPALGGKAAPTPSPRSTRYTEGAGFGSAAQPSGGQAPLPQRAMQQPATCCPPLAFLWRAGLPRAGRQSRPNSLTKSCQIHRGGLSL